MFVRLLNKIGLYTAKQIKEIEFYTEEVEIRLEKYMSFCDSLGEENEKLKQDYENLIAALRVCEDKKRELLLENEDLRRALENRKKQIDMFLKDFERVSDENEKLRLKIAKSVKIAKRVKRKKI